VALLGQYLQQSGILDDLRASVQICQQTRRYPPAEKLISELICILAGGEGVVDINSRVRPDAALQHAYGLRGCAEQSTISRTLEACTAENVLQLRGVVERALQQHGECFRHDFRGGPLVLDIDISGLPCGKQAQGASRGYFAQKRGIQGRQLGRVLASGADEVVVEKVYAGNRQLVHIQRGLMQEAERVLHLTRHQRRQVLVRLDSGGSAEAELNWLLKRGYGVLTKITHYRRCHRLAASVREWFADPTRADRQWGWAEAPHPYARPTRQLVIRYADKGGQPHLYVLVAALPDAWAPSAQQLLHWYDQRGGGVETSFRNSHDGLNLRKRNKAKLAPQEILVLLAQLAYNLLSWFRRQAFPKLPLGFKRLRKEVLQMEAHVGLHPSGRVTICLSSHYPRARPLARAFFPCLDPQKTSLFCA
jgi:hypothetical protein